MDKRLPERACTFWIPSIHKPSSLQLDQHETPFQVFVGIDNTAEVFPRNAYPILFHGACVLIRFTPSNECWFFGICLAKFTLNENIQALYSPIGNNDVVYAYLMTDRKCYIFEEGLYSIDKETLSNRPPGESIHEHFYSQTLMWTRSDYSFLSKRVTLQPDTIFTNHL